MFNKTNQPPKSTSPLATSSGGRNLLLLGLGAITIAFITTTASLIVYHHSGDIYLDRSRPGFLPDKNEASVLKPHSSQYRFSDSGPINSEILDKYLKNFKPQLQALEQFSPAFSTEVLSDQSLGISPTAPNQINQDL
ncbi:MAG: hypothetical protein Q4A30_00090 [Candidatus Saccharibacteria bacterium]|nr:hypothetical protein [Candidatus Saccharibacteria bacterium]